MVFRSMMALAAMLPFAGCKPPDRDRCTVEGKAHFRGQPLAGYRIVLFSEAFGGGGAAIQTDGSFEFAGPMQEGEYTVAFVIPSETSTETKARIAALGLPEKYRNGDRSDTRVTIQPGRNALNIEVKP